MLLGQTAKRFRTIRIYGDFECLDVEHMHCEYGSDADVKCSNCFYVRAIEGVIHERPYDDFDPDFVGLRFRGNFIALSSDYIEWEVIDSEEVMPHVPYDIFYNGTFCKVSTIEDDKIYYQAGRNQNYEYYAIFKMVRQKTLNKLKKYVKDNFVEKFSYLGIGKDDRGGKIYCVLIVLHK